VNAARIKTLRWWIAGLLALATALSYLDRQSFPLVVSEARKEIPISNEQFATLNSCFLFAYAIMYAGGGRIMDWLGTRAGYAMMIIWWSGATFATGLVSSVTGFGVCRFLLGMGEGGGFPGSGKAVSEWFPPRERSVAFGLFNAGSSLGAVVGPPMIAVIVSQLGWRWTFFISGSIGFLWALFWLKVYFPPATNPYISVTERDYIQRELVASRTQDSDRKIRWLQLFHHREVIGLMAAKFLTDAAWYFFIFWLPKYLADIRHLNIKDIGYFAWIPYGFSGLGSIIGGLLGAWLIRRGHSLDRARKIALGIAACLMPTSLFITQSPLHLAIVFFSLAMFAHQFWSANIQTLPADLFPSKIVGSVEGLLGSAGAFGGVLFGQFVGGMVEKHGFAIPFVFAGILHPLAFVVILLTVRRIAPLRLDAPVCST